MKQLNNIIICLIVLSFWGCSSTSERENDKGSKQIQLKKCLTLQKIAELENTPSVVGRIESFTMINDSNFLVSTSKPPRVFKYNTKGSQLQQIGKVGRGPYEYINPDIVKANNNNVYIWCSNLLKLIIFDNSGTPLKEYNFDKAIKEFLPYKNFLCFYSSGGFDEPIIKIFDLSKNKLINDGYGIKSNEHKLLNMKEGSGGLAIKDSMLYFTPTNSLTINEINLNTLKKGESYKIDDPDFNTQKMKGDINTLIEKSQAEMFKYIYGTAVTNGIFCIDSLLILKSIIGDIEIDDKTLEFKDISKKYHKFYIFNKHIELLFILKMKLEDCQYLFFSSTKKNLYTIKLKDDQETYVLNKVLLTQDLP